MPSDQDTPDNQPPKKRGGQPGNQNARRHGLRSTSLTKETRYIEHVIGRVRSNIEQAVVKQKGEVSILDAALIQSLCRHEMRAMLLGRWLRELMENETPANLADRKSTLASLSRATDDRDRCLTRLDLGKDEASVWIFPEEPTPTPTPRNDSTDSRCEDAPQSTSKCQDDTNPVFGTEGVESDSRASNLSGDDDDVFKDFIASQTRGNG